MTCLLTLVICEFRGQAPFQICPRLCLYLSCLTHTFSPAAEGMAREVREWEARLSRRALGVGGRWDWVALCGGGLWPLMLGRTYVVQKMELQSAACKTSVLPPSLSQIRDFMEKASSLRSPGLGVLVAERNYAPGPSLPSGRILRVLKLPEGNHLRNHLWIDSSLAQVCPRNVFLKRRCSLSAYLLPVGLSIIRGCYPS